jgi:dihydroorotate dehydrogenase (NAD+) catalytic subunit
MSKPKAGKNETVDLSVTIAGLRLQNPVIAASGTFGYGSEYAAMIDVSRLGGICTKGLTLTPRPGNKGQRIWETSSGLLNSIGLENPGIRSFIKDELPELRKLASSAGSRGPAVIANLAGSTVEEYAEGAELLAASAVDMIELNISCPNVKAGGMAFGLEPKAAGEVTSAARGACKGLPLMVKLSPNAPDIGAVAAACVKAGADALSLVNTFKAMAIDVAGRKPVFDNISAGLSGPAIKPIALRMIWELYGRLRSENLVVPIVGMGGIACATDALEFFMAGAAAVQVGSATFPHPATMIEIIDALERYMRKNRIASVDEISIRKEFPA